MQYAFGLVRNSVDDAARLKTLNKVRIIRGGEGEINIAFFAVADAVFAVRREAHGRQLFLCKIVIHIRHAGLFAAAQHHAQLSVALNARIPQGAQTVQRYDRA